MKKTVGHHHIITEKHPANLTSWLFTPDKSHGEQEK